MELWRALGAAAVGSAGLLLVLVAIAQARDSAIPGSRTGRDGRRAKIAQTSGIGLAILIVVLALVITVLPPLVVWGLAAAFWLILLALFLAG